MQIKNVNHSVGTWMVIFSTKYACLDSEDLLLEDKPQSKENTEKSGSKLYHFKRDTFQIHTVRLALKMCRADSFRACAKLAQEQMQIKNVNHSVGAWMVIFSTKYVCLDSEDLLLEDKPQSKENTEKSGSKLYHFKRDTFQIHTARFALEMCRADSFRACTACSP